MHELELFIEPKKKSPEEEKKEKEAIEKQKAGQPLSPEQEALLAASGEVFMANEIMQAIRPVSTFEPEFLDYYNFLECIIRVVKARPWSEEEEADAPDFASKIAKVTSQMEATYMDVVMDDFVKQRENFEAERRYQPRIVVDDEEGDLDYEDD